MNEERGEVALKTQKTSEISKADDERGDDELPPMTPTELDSAPRVPRTKTLRRALRMTQEVFAVAYGIPLGTLRDWEQGAAQPDQATRSYLRAIAGDPEGIRRALTNIPPPPPAP